MQIETPIKPAIARINAVALNSADELLSADEMRQRACSELLRQRAIATGLLPEDDAPGEGGVLSEAASSAIEALLEQTADGLERMQRNMADGERDRQLTAQRLAELSTQMGRVADVLTRDARDRQNADEVQEELRTVMRQLASQPSGEGRLNDELRSELRLLSRTIAAAVDGARGTRDARP